MRAYSKPPDIDPLSPPEEATYSDDEFVNFPDTCPPKISAGEPYENTRFYGKSSVIVLTNQLVNQRYEGAGECFMKNRRKQFWEAPDVNTTLLFWMFYC